MRFGINFGFLSNIFKKKISLNEYLKNLKDNAHVSFVDKDGGIIMVIKHPDDNYYNNDVIRFETINKLGEHEIRDIEFVEISLAKFIMPDGVYHPWQKGIL